MAGIRQYDGIEIHHNGYGNKDDTSVLHLSIRIKVFNDSVIKLFANDTAYPHNTSWYFYQYKYVSLELNHVSSNMQSNSISFYGEFLYHDKYSGGYVIRDTVTYDYVNNVITEHQQGYVGSRPYSIYMYSK